MWKVEPIEKDFTRPIEEELPSSDSECDMNMHMSDIASC